MHILRPPSPVLSGKRRAVQRRRAVHRAIYRYQISHRRIGGAIRSSLEGIPLGRVGRLRSQPAFDMGEHFRGFVPVRRTAMPRPAARRGYKAVRANYAGRSIEGLVFEYEATSFVRLDEC